MGGLGVTSSWSHAFGCGKSAGLAREVRGRGKSYTGMLDAMNGDDHNGKWSQELLHIL